MAKRSLSDVLLSEELLSHVRGGHTGWLAVRAGEVTKTVCIDSGRLVFASSSREEDKLGEQLIRLGRISRAEFVAAFQRSSATGERFGKALVGAGLMTDEEVGRLVARQVQKIILSLFTWTSGEMEFRAADQPAPPDLAVHLSTHRLLFEGSRIFTDAARLERALGAPGQRLHRAEPPPFDTARVRFTSVEQAVLEEAGRQSRLGDVLDTLRPHDLVAAALYACLAGGLIETDALPRTEHADVVEPELGTFQVATVETPAAQVEDPSDRILRVFETLPRATHYEILGVASDATPEQVQAAYDRLATEQREDAKNVVSDVRIDHALEAIAKRRQEAFEALSDIRRRKSYDRSLSSPSPTQPRSTPETADAHARALRLGREAGQRLQKGARDAAVTLLLEAVEADPKERSVRRQLAIILADHPTLSRQAERHFRTALDQDPHDVDLRCRFSRYYRHKHMLARARMNIEAALRVAPEYEPALRELEALEDLERRTRR